MKTMLKKTSWLLASLFLGLCIAHNVHADASNLDTGVGGTSDSVAIVKDLLLIDTSDNSYVPSVPNVDFNYTVSPISADTTDTIDSTKDVPILRGAAPTSVGKASFTPKSSVTATSGKNYASSSFTIDFTGVTWAKPGIYRYTVNETGFSTVGNKYAYTSTDITTLSNGDAKRILDVFVEFDSQTNTNKIKGYVLYKEIESGKSKVNGYVYNDSKASTYSTYDLNVKKVVTGTGGDRKQAFSITTKLPIDAGSKYQLTGPNNATSTIENDGNSKKDSSNAVDLIHDQSYKIKGIPLSASYTVSETAVDGYTTKVEYFDKAADGTKGESGTATNRFAIVTNNKDAIPPTGIIVSVVPYIAMLGAVIALGWLFIIKPKHRS